MPLTDILSDAEVAALLDCETSTVQELTRSKRLPFVKFGRSAMFPRAALMECLNRQALENMIAIPLAPTAKAVPLRKVAPPALPKLSSQP